jgi:hypothetical protein
MSPEGFFLPGNSFGMNFFPILTIDVGLSKPPSKRIALVGQSPRVIGGGLYYCRIGLIPDYYYL